MVTTILSDFSRVILNPKDKNYKGTLNGLHKELSEKEMNYPFFDYFEFNDEILNLYRQLKTKYSVNVFTTGTIQNRPEVRQIIDPIFNNIYTAKDFGLDKRQPEVRQIIDPIFNNIYTAKDFGLDKRQPEVYLFIAKKLDKKPSEILFIDDQVGNIQAAKKAGLNTIQYLKFEELVLELKDYLSGYKD